MMNAAAVPSAEQRVDMERHDAVRTAGDLLWRRPLHMDRETLRTHVVALLLESCVKQERWSR